MDKQKREMLLKAAIAARENSYAPYSHFSVGAALLSEDGRIFCGANIEFSSFSPTVCAERVALHSAVFAGVRRFCAVAIVGGREGEPISAYCPPCGVCRQALAEFCDGSLAVLLFDGKQAKCYTLGELLPESFGKSNLK